MTDQVGQQLGNYRLMHVLGRGNFADVYLGQHIHLNTQAAVKVLHEQLVDDDLASFLTEARTIARLRHPHIIQVLDFGMEGTTPFLVMDYAPNGNLRQRYPYGTRLSLDAVVSYVKQVADALQYAHDERLVHRDIKPENMLVGRNHEVLLSDFGIAILIRHASSQLAQQGQDIAGTIAYMAPEQFQAHPVPASDQYALGIIVYEWLCGDRPFHGAFPEIAVKHTLVAPPSLHETVPSIPSAVEQVVLTALTKDPEQRFACVQDFAVSLEEASRAAASGRTHFLTASEHPVLTEQRPTSHLPTGTVTLLFADIERSTHLLQQLGSRYATMLSAYRDLLRPVLRQWHGYEVDIQGDSFFAVFARATDAVSAAVTAQRSLSIHSWPEDVAVRVRMGLHTGEPDRSSEGYTGLDVHYAARIMSAAHGGQVLLSQTTQELVAHALPERVRLRDVGVYHLKDFRGPRRLFQLVMADLPAAFPPLRTLDARFNNLPVQLTSLIGREQEVSGVCTLLQREDVRLVTLTGTGGIGKTRLGLAVATALLVNFADGVCFVPLASINDATLVIPTVAHLLGLEHMHTGSESAQVDMDYLKTFFKEKRFLLLLDNFEQVIVAAPDLTELLMACPYLNMLVTSRANLHIEGEYEFPVPPLAFPKRLQASESENLVQYAAITLFLQRALTVKPDFAITKANIHAIASICKHLDGLPLAIELAAARIKVLPPQALLRRLTHRLDILTGGMQDVALRQQTLRNTIAWSYHLLDAAEQRLFRRLSVFVGGCTLEAIESISHVFEPGAEQVLNGVASLIDKSLLQQSEQEGDEPRLIMLETIREFGLECLASVGELEATRQAHAAYYLHLAEEADAHLYEKWWFERLQWEHNNLRAALNWSTGQMEGMEEKAAGQRGEMALRLAGALVRFWLARGFIREGQTWLKQVLMDTESSEEIQPLVRAEVLDRVGWLFVMVNDVNQAEVLFHESLRLYREAKEMGRAAWPLLWLGWCALKRGNRNQGRSLLQESLALARGMGKTSWLNEGAVPLFLGVLDSGLGEYAEARSLLEEALAFYREKNIREKNIQEGIAWSLRYLGYVLFAQDEKGRAAALFEESLALSRELGNWTGLAYSLYWLGRCAIARGDVTRARELLEESLDLYKTRVMYPQSNTALVLSQLASVTAQQGDYMAAEAFYQESLTLFRQTDERAGMAFCLQGWGELVARQGKLIWAARLWGAAEILGSPDRIPSPITLPFEHTVAERMEYERVVSTARAELGERAFATAWAEGRAMTPEQALANQGIETAETPTTPVPQPSDAPVHRRVYPAGLTAREVQVLRLVAQGLKNNEIAEGLELSEKTIAHHLTHIFNKTSSENRAAAAAFAIRHGLA